jgi:hypothetical protein
MTEMRQARFVWILPLVAVAALGCDRSSPPPTAPSTAGGSITISGGRPLIEGDTATLTATLRSSTGASSDVTGTVTWSSDTPGVATVSDRGVVTALAAGNAQIRAALQAISGATTLVVAAGAHVVSGEIHESAPTERIRIRGATIAVVDSGGGAQTALSDAAGNFTLSARTGLAQIAVSAAGYDRTTTSVDVRADTALSLALVPVLQEVRLTFPSEPPRPGLFVDERTFHVDLHHAGEIRAAITGASVSHGDGEQVFCMELRDSSNRVINRSRGSFDVRPFPIHMGVGIGSYEVKVMVCADSVAFINVFPSFSATTLSGEIKHPR